MAEKIIPWFPPHDVYVEPFGGAGSVLTQKRPVRSEIWNDLDSDLVNLFEVVREPRLNLALQRAVSLTPYSRREFVGAYVTCDDPVERARRLLIRSHFAHGTNGSRIDRKPGFRVDGVTGQTRVAKEWGDFSIELARFQHRWSRVTLECSPASEIIRRYDDARALLYVDPPYVPATRSQKLNGGALDCGYVHELSIEEHEALLDQLLASKSMIVLSGYASDLYDGRLKGWRRLELAARSHRNSPRVEILWINAAASTAHGLFAS